MSFGASSCCITAKLGRSCRFGSITTGRGKLQIQPCPQCTVSDGRLEKGDLSLRATTKLMRCSKQSP